MQSPFVFRDRLRLALERQGRSPYWLAQQVEASPQAVLNLLDDPPAEPKWPRAVAIAVALGVSLDWLAGRSEKSEVST